LSEEFFDVEKRVRSGGKSWGEQGGGEVQIGWERGWRLTLTDRGNIAHELAVVASSAHQP
jgi:hypothetical protein